MNDDKTKLFGWNERMVDTKMTIETTSHGPQGQTDMTVRARPTTEHIQYLGIWMNMHLDWDK